MRIDQDIETIVERVRVMAQDITILIILNLSKTTISTEKARKAHLKQRALDTRKAAELIDRFRKCGFYVKSFDDEVQFMKEILTDPISGTDCDRTFVYSVGAENSGPGTRALAPAFCARLGIKCLNSNAHARSLVWHKYHNFQVLREAELPVPDTWLFCGAKGWRGGRQPRPGAKVITKSTYEAWAVGVDDNSVCIVDDRFLSAVQAKYEEIGQPVTVQSFIGGKEVYVPLFELSGFWCPGPMEVVKRHAQKEDFVITFQDNVTPNSISFVPYQTSASELIHIAEQAMQILEIESISRIDFRIGSDNKPFIIDVAEVPSLHPSHALAQSFALKGHGPEKLPLLMMAANLIRTGQLEL